MAWVKSSVNGNVFEVGDETLARQLEAAGHSVTENDPRAQKPKARDSKS